MKKKIGILFLTLFSMGTLVLSTGCNSSTKHNSDYVADAGKIIQTSIIKASKELEDEKSGGLYYLSSPSCPRCEESKPIIKKVAKDSGVPIKEVVIDNLERDDEYLNASVKLQSKLTALQRMSGKDEVLTLPIIIYKDKTAIRMLDQIDYKNDKKMKELIEDSGKETKETKERK